MLLEPNERFDMTDAAATANDARTPEETLAARDLFSKFDPLIAEREALLATGVRDPFAIVMDEVKSPTQAVIKGKDTILLGTYNYMGMTFDPDVVAAGKKAYPPWPGAAKARPWAPRISGFFDFAIRVAVKHHRKGSCASTSVHQSSSSRRAKCAKCATTADI